MTLCRRERSTTHTHTYTHTPSWSSQMSKSPQTKSLAARYLKDTTNWSVSECVRLRDTVPRVQSILYVCHWNWLTAYSPDTHTHTQPIHKYLSLTILNILFAILSIKRQGKEPKVDFFFLFFFNPLSFEMSIFI